MNPFTFITQQRVTVPTTKYDQYKKMQEMMWTLEEQTIVQQG